MGETTSKTIDGGESHSRFRRRRRVGEVATVLATLPEIPASDERERLGQILIELDLCSEDQIERAIEEETSIADPGGSVRPIGQRLIDLGLIDDRGLARSLARQFGLAYVDLRKQRPSIDALALVSDNAARQHSVVPLRIHDGCLELAVADPADSEMRAFVEALPVATVSFAVATPEDIQSVLNSSYRVLQGVETQIDQFVSGSGPARNAPEVVLDLIGTDSAPVVAVVDRIVAQALRDRASDVHVEPNGEHVRVRFRIDGTLKEILTLPESLGPAISSRVKVMAEMNIVEKRRPQDGQFQRRVDGRDVDVRVSTSATIWGEKVVMRLLEKRRSLLQLSDLGMREDVHKAFSDIAHRPYGMVLCSGPTGAGKTTTLYATLQEITSPEVNVMTIEDPVEYVFPEVNQIQINEQAEITFASGLRAILRQDPDVILVGEVRDPETARIAVQSALTGHFVLSSIHATDAASALYRLLDMGVEPFLVASSVSAVVGQRLVRRVCPSCAEEYQPAARELLVFTELGGDPNTVFTRGVGCNYCSFTGFRGRVGIYEVLEITDEVRQYVVERRTPQALRELALSNGMRSLADEAVALVHSHVTTIDEVVRTVYLGS